MKFTNISEIPQSFWVSKCYANLFSIILPDGWIGSPYSQRYKLTDVKFENETVRFIFDELRSILVFNPQEYEIYKDQNFSYLKFNKYSKIELNIVPFNKALKPFPKATQTYQGDQGQGLTLVGYFKGK